MLLLTAWQIERERLLGHVPFKNILFAFQFLCNESDGVFQFFVHASDCLKFFDAVQKLPSVI